MTIVNGFRSLFGKKSKLRNFGFVKFQPTFHRNDDVKKFKGAHFTAESKADYSSSYFDDTCVYFLLKKEQPNFESFHLLSDINLRKLRFPYTFKVSDYESTCLIGYNFKGITYTGYSNKPEMKITFIALDGNWLKGFFCGVFSNDSNEFVMVENGIFHVHLDVK